MVINISNKMSNYSRFHVFCRFLVYLIMQTRGDQKIVLHNVFMDSGLNLIKYFFLEKTFSPSLTMEVGFIFPVGSKSSF